jgi:hypothetical protein
MGAIHILQGIIAAASSGGGSGGGGGGGGGASYRSWTIEWWSKKQSPQTNTVPRIFSCGVDTGASIGYSNESGGDYIWTGGVSAFGGPTSVGSTANTWFHWAIVSDGTNLTLYRNGVSLSSAPRTGSAITDTTTALTVGTDTSNGWKGLITDFHIIKGTAKYTGNFTPPTSRIQTQTGTQVLLYANGGSIVNAGPISGSASNWAYSDDDPYNDGAGSITFDGSAAILSYQGGSWIALDVA